jgi:replicative DNA helicase
MAVDYDIPVGMFSLEMSCEQLATRLFVGEAEIEQIKLQTGNIRESDIGKLQSAQEKLSAAKIFLDDTPGLPIYEFKSKCRRMVEMNHVKCIVVDYLQLMTAPGYGSREQEVSNISRQIKATAMELKIPIIALAQLNRGVEGRIGTKEKKPRLSDLRESGAIEQDADLVMFIHRDAKALGTNEIEGRDISKDADIIVAKNRHGASDDIKLQFIGQYMKFKEPENDNFVPLEQINNTSDPTILDSSLNSLENEQFAMDKSSEMPF